MPIQRVKPKFSDVRNVSIAASTMPAGTVIQTVVQQEDGATSFTASGTNDLILLASNAADSTSHLSVSITPTSASSKILLSASVFFEGSNHAHQHIWTFHRDSTKLTAPTAGSRRSGLVMPGVGYYAADNDSTPEAVNMLYYDSPNSTSAITYAVSFQCSNSNAIVYLNRTKTDSNSVGYERGVSIITAQEIKV